MVPIHYRFNSEISQLEKDKLREYLDDKINKWDKYFKHSDYPPRVNVEVEFLPKKKRYRVEMQMETSLGRIIGACEKQNMYEGADEVIEDVRNQFHRQKDKILTLRRRAGMSIKKLFRVHKSARFRLPGWLRERLGRKRK
jgi:ribosomal subunit interface protein